MRTILWFLYFWLYLVALLPKMHRAKKLEAQGRRDLADAITEREVRKWASALLKAAGAKVKVEGLENIPQGKACLFIGNHQGNFDVPIMLSQLPKPYGLLSKIETQKIPLICQWMKLLHCVFVDRKDPRQSVTALNECAHLLSEGYSMIIFPEGTRSRGDAMNEFKGGAFKIASKAGVPIVPMAMNGSYRLMEAHGFRIHPASVTLKILPPIETASLSREELKALPETVKELIAQNITPASGASA